MESNNEVVIKISISGTDFPVIPILINKFSPMIMYISSEKLPLKNSIYFCIKDSNRISAFKEFINSIYFIDNSENKLDLLKEKLYVTIPIICFSEYQCIENIVVDNTVIENRQLFNSIISYETDLTPENIINILRKFYGISYFNIIEPISYSIQGSVYETNKSLCNKCKCASEGLVCPVFTNILNCVLEVGKNVYKEINNE